MAALLAATFALSLAAQADPRDMSANSGASRSPAAIPLSNDEVTRKLRAAVEESLARIGPIEPWQKKLFDEEAVPQYQRFIRDYRSSPTHSGTASGGLAVDIDVESIKNYLKFFGPKSLGRVGQDSQILLYLRSGEGCEKCVAAGPALRKLVASRVANRGFRAVWVTADDLGVTQALEGKALEEKLEQLAETRNAAASLVMQWAPAPVDDIDTAHAEDKRFVIRTVIKVRGLVTPAIAHSPAGATITGRNEGHMELLENDLFEAAGTRLMTDAFADLGVQASRAEIATKSSLSLEGGEQPEVALDVTGVRDFPQLARLKAQLQAKLAGISVEERKISRGRAVFALVGAKSADALKGELNGLSLEPGRLALPVSRAGASAEAPQGDESLRMEIYP